MKRFNILFVAFLGLSLSLIGLSAAEPIRLGGLFDLTGPAQQIGVPTKEVALMMVEKLNREGGLNGRPIELVIADTQSDPSQAVVALKRLLNKDKVVAIIGPTTTGAAMACMKTIEEAQIPMVACVGGDAPVKETRKWVFKTPQRTSTAVECLFKYLKSKELSKISVLYASNKFGQEGQGYLKAMAGNYGISILAEESFDPKDADMTAQLSKAAAAKPAAIVVWTIGSAGAMIAKNAEQANIGLPLFQCHGQPDPNYIKLAGSAAEGTRMPSTRLMAAEQLPASDRQRAGVLEFIQAYKQRGLSGLSTHSGYAWDAVQLVFNAMKKAGPEPAAVRDALEQTKDYIGVSGIYNMSPTDHCRLGVDSLVILQVTGSQWKLLN